MSISIERSQREELNDAILGIFGQPSTEIWSKQAIVFESTLETDMSGASGELHATLKDSANIVAQIDVTQSSTGSGERRSSRSSEKPKYLADSGAEYTIIAELGFGFGRNICRDNNTGNHYVIKLLRGQSYLRELDALREVTRRGCFHFPKLHDFGHMSTSPRRKFVVMTLLGENLGWAVNRVRFSRMEQFQNGLSKPTCLAIAVQTLSAIEELHYCGFVSRDIKPENFVCGRRWPDTGNIFLLDFATSRRYINENGLHITEKHKRFSGTAHYSSIAQHEKEAPSRVDDLEAWFYTLLHIFDGTLDWSDLGRDDSSRIVAKKKALRTKPEICRKFPEMMERILGIIDNNGRYQTPQYSEIYEILDAEMRANNCSLDCHYDWELVPGYNENFLGYTVS